MTRPDIVVIDQTATSVHSDVEHLQLITQRFESIPILLLAQRSDEADMLIEQKHWSMHLYDSPIRANSLLQAIRKLTANPNGGQES